MGNREKLFILGHSLGSLIAVRFCRLYDDVSPAGLILSGPPFRLKVSIPMWWNRLGVIFAGIFPAMTFKEESIQVTMLTHDKEKLDAFMKDSCRHYHRSLRFIREYFRAEKMAFEDGASLSLPVLIVQGGDDHIVEVQKIKDFYQTVNVEDKTLIVYPDMYHEVLNEIDRKRVFSDISDWILHRC